MRFPFDAGIKILIMPKKIPAEKSEHPPHLVLDHLDDHPKLTTACNAVASFSGSAVNSCAGVHGT
jgi:hypothetical protein